MKILVMALVSVISLPVFSQKINLDEKERSIARAENMEISKQICIQFWTNPDRLKLLMDARIGLDEQCKCTQDSAGYLISDELAAYASHAYYEIRVNGIEKLDPFLKIKLDEHYKLVMASMQGCSNKLLKR